MKKRVLVVDDEMDFTHMVKMVLEMTGDYTVREVVYAASVLEMAREFKPDVILLDCMMPGMDGGEVAAQIQNDPALKDTPFIFLTATVAAPEKSGSGCFGGEQTFLPKPIQLDGLIACIEEKTRKPAVDSGGAVA